MNDINRCLVSCLKFFFDVYRVEEVRFNNFYHDIHITVRPAFSSDKGAENTYGCNSEIFLECCFLGFKNPEYLIKV